MIGVVPFGAIPAGATPASARTTPAPREAAIHVHAGRDDRPPETREAVCGIAAVFDRHVR